MPFRLHNTMPLTFSAYLCGFWNPLLASPCAWSYFNALQPLHIYYELGKIFRKQKEKSHLMQKGGVSFGQQQAASEISAEFLLKGLNSMLHAKMTLLRV